MLKVGSTLNLHVNVSGIPNPDIMWCLDEEPLEKSERVSIETNDKYSTVTVKNATLDDTGLYTISAQNVVGEARAEFDVTVRGENSLRLLSKPPASKNTRVKTKKPQWVKAKKPHWIKTEKVSL